MLNVRKLLLSSVFVFFFCGCTLRWPPAPSESPVRVKASAFPRPGVAVQVDLDPIPQSEREAISSRPRDPSERPFPFPKPTFRMDNGIRWYPGMGHPIFGDYFRLSVREFVVRETMSPSSPWIPASLGTPIEFRRTSDVELLLIRLPPLQLVPPAPMFEYE